MIGQTFSHYTILELIHKGGMGELYSAVDTKLNRKVAVKFLPPDKAADPDSRKRFLHEAGAQGMLNHPNIATFYEAGEMGDTVFIVMEYVEGRSLGRLIKEEEPTLKEILELALQIGEGLQAAHEAGVIHRDIKPENILVTSKQQVKITDFGLAKWKGASTITKTGTSMGTPSYMSPEQTRGEKADHRSDLFSFGAVLYELITGRQPFRDEHKDAISYSICYEEPEPLSRYKAGVPPSLQRIIDKALQKDRNLRYQSAADLTADLKCVLNEITTGHPTFRPRPKPFYRRPFLSAAAILLALIGYTVWRWIFPPGEETDFQRTMLAVLPLRNLGPSEQEYFSDGLTDEITTSLAKISGLGVISNTSARKYKGATRNLREIGKELEVDYALEGTTQLDTSGGTRKARINVQLIRINDDINLWAQTYTPARGQIFDLQSDIAEKVAQALNIVLLEPEQRYLKDRPTENIEAYNYFLRGSSHLNKFELLEAARAYQKVIALDSRFALAYARLSKTYLLGATTWYYRSWREKQEDSFVIITNKGWWDSAHQVVQKALQLQPNLPEAHFALGYYLYGRYRDYDQAMAVLARVQKHQPNNSELLSILGSIQLSQGNWKEGLANIKKAIKLDPLSASRHLQAGQAHLKLREYEKAEKYFERVIPLGSVREKSSAYREKALCHLLREGNISIARRILSEGFLQTFSQAFMQELIFCNMVDGNYREALAMFTYIKPDKDTLRLFHPLLKAQILGLANLPNQAKVQFDSARIWFEGWVAEEPEKAEFHSYLGNAYAGLGRKEEAIREGKKAIELQPVSKDALDGPENHESLARTYAIVGEPELAIDQLEYLLSIPSEISVPLLRIDPTWAPLRNHPRFQKLLAKK